MENMRVGCCGVVEMTRVFAGTKKWWRV